MVGLGLGSKSDAVLKSRRSAHSIPLVYQTSYSIKGGYESSLAQLVLDQLTQASRNCPIISQVSTDVPLDNLFQEFSRY